MKSQRDDVNGKCKCIYTQAVYEGCINNYSVANVHNLDCVSSAS